ncbi:BatD family protein [Gilvimarinus sp. F26214L]|uniref:BatD family protein n=1 Tax=Gilvimarinus sp. DZF01 TaxID=3461371 RepID=UPI004045A0A4
MMKSFNRGFWAATLALLLGMASATASGADLTVSVDRSIISENETLELSVRLSEQVGYSSPDFSALEQDFEILRQQRSSQFRNVNGVIESWTEWTLTLSPRNAGTLTIPPFNFQGASSSPLQITVNNAGTNQSNNAQELFVEVDTDKSQLYVQEQLLVTIRLHTGILLRDASMDRDLSIDNAVVENLTETAYNKQIDGRLYRVMELVYAVYPQQSGELTIPGLSWTLVMATEPGSGFRNRFRSPGDVRRLRSDPVTIPVKPQAPQFSGSHWLPARNVELDQHWSSDPSRFVVGEPLTRTITLRAEGLTSAQLPPLPDQDVDGLKIYTDQPQFDNLQSAQGITGHRVESFAIVPTRPGKLTLPETRVQWWDTEAQQPRTATIPAQELTVAPAANQSSQLPLRDSAQLSGDASNEGAEGRDGAGGRDGADLPWPWLISNLVWAALALGFMVAWWRKRNAGAPARNDARPDENSSRGDGALDAVRRACSDHDPNAARAHLGRWAKEYWALPRVASVQEIATKADYEPLTKELEQLDKILYGTQQSGQWQGEKLWQTLVKFKRRDKKKRTSHTKKENDLLPPLYPSTH